MRSPAGRAFSWFPAAAAMRDPETETPPLRDAKGGHQALASSSSSELEDDVKNGHATQDDAASATASSPGGDTVRVVVVQQAPHCSAESSPLSPRLVAQNATALTTGSSKKSSLGGGPLSDADAMRHGASSLVGGSGSSVVATNDDTHGKSGALPASGAGRGAYPTERRVKTALLGALVVQNAMLNVTARRARVYAWQEEERTGCGFLSTTAVVTIEVLKIVLAFCLLRYLELPRSSFWGAARAIAATAREHPVDCAKILVPAFLYTVSNNLVLVAADNLEGPLLSLFGQLKILYTAVFSITLLGRQLGVRRWFAIVALAISIAVVQTAKQREADRAAEDGNAEDGEFNGDEGKKNILLGLVATSVACAISGFAGVYFELVLKTSPISVWIRNIHLATFSAAVAAAVVAVNDADAVSRCGFFAGYGPPVVFYVVAQACGGLLIAAVIKHADNILKAFATAVAVLVIAVISHALYAFKLSAQFFLGCGGVVFAILLYADLLRHAPLYGRFLPGCLGGRRPGCGVAVTCVVDDDLDVRWSWLGV